MPDDHRCIDLHTHSRCSDGLLAPAALVAAARDNGLAAIALTDHDTTAGLAEALAAGRKLGVEVIAGVEISAFWEGVPVHILGYGIDAENQALQDCLAELQAIRQRRNQGIQRRLAEKGIVITDTDLAAAAPGLVGRPHFARILVERGVVADGEEAFRRFLRRNAAAYVPKEPFDACRAIGAIGASGGIAVLAHPHTCPVQSKVPAMIEDLTACGLGGIEVFYPSMPPSYTEKLQRLATAFSLAATGGSDYHGEGHQHPLAGCRPGSFTVPYRLLTELKARLGRP